MNQKADLRVVYFYGVTLTVVGTGITCNINCLCLDTKWKSYGQKNSCRYKFDSEGEHLFQVGSTKTEDFGSRTNYLSSGIQCGGVQGRLQNSTTGPPRPGVAA